MLRSLLFAVGIFLLIAGVQTLCVDKWIMSYEIPTPQTTNNSGRYYNNNPYRTASYSRFGNAGFNNRYAQPTSAAGTIKPVYQTRDWMPWSLLAGGTIIVLYTYSMGRNNEG